jgi:hypothetical protein
MQALFSLVIPTIAGLYALLLVIAAIFRPRVLSGPAFNPVFRFPGGKLEIGRLGALMLGLLLAGICAQVIAHHLGLLP